MRYNNKSNLDQQGLEYYDDLRDDDLEDDSLDIDFKYIIALFLVHWKWFAISVAVCLSFAYLKLRLAVPTYKSVAQIMIKDDESSQRPVMNGIAAMVDMGMDMTSSFDNEVFVLKSKTLGKQAVTDEGLYISCFREGRFKKYDMYGEEQIVTTVDTAAINILNSNESAGASFHLDIEEDNQYSLVGVVSNGKKKESIKENFKSLPHVVSTSLGKIMLAKKHENSNIAPQKLIINIEPPVVVARRFMSGFNVEPASKTTTVADLSYVDINGKRSTVFLSAMVNAYNKQAQADKDEVATKTGLFIDERLAVISGELSSTDKNLEDYKQSSGLVDLVTDSRQALTQNSSYEQKIVDIQTQQNLVQYLKDYVNKDENYMGVIPANIGISDESLSQLITAYNAKVLERNILLKTSTENNPSVRDITSTVQDMYANIKNTIQSVQHGLQINRRNLDRQEGSINQKIVKAPQHERYLNDILRQQEVKNGIYLLLLQKREENAITLASTTNKAKIVDEPTLMGQVSPKKNIFYIIALAIGFIIPIIVFYVNSLLKYKVETRMDVVKATHKPILGTVPRANVLQEGERAIVVKKDKNDLMAETFRTLRTNLNFMLKGKEHSVILFTSTSSEEGKTFISSNMAMSFALLDKKVLIVGLDIRKPRLLKIFNIKRQNNEKRGVTDFLSSAQIDFSLLDAAIISNGVLDILPSGTIPPNPAELLSGDRLKIAIDYLKPKYDYILLDTAPVGMVADTLSIGPLADASVYVCRANFTPKEDLDLVSNIDDKLNNICMVINDIDLSKQDSFGHYGRYGYRSRYGYYRHYYNYKASGYGYGFGYGYGERNQKEKDEE
jgi:capsular exopolysaccharide synthesis family protein